MPPPGSARPGESTWEGLRTAPPLRAKGHGKGLRRAANGATFGALVRPAGLRYLTLMASTGHSGTQVSHSVQVS